jgi:glycosyltransferase involved in cell wall biosynthesis
METFLESAMTSLVSIVIPCYRQGRWLRTAVDSCLAQSYSPIEIIVINDGSDDDSESIAKSIGKIRYYHQENAGQSSARNLGLRHSYGEYVLFLDADDALHPQAIERLITMASMDPPRIGMMGWKPFENNVDEPGPEVFPPLESPIASLLQNNPGPPHMFLSPRSTLECINGWDIHLSGTSDWDCWFRQLFAGADLSAVPFIGAYYRQSPGQLSRNELVMTENLALASEKLLQLARIHPNRLQDWNLKPETTIEAFRVRAAKEYSHLAYLHRRQGHRRLAAKYALRAVRLGHRGAWKGLLKAGLP